MHVLLLLVSAVAGALGLLTVCRSPDWLPFQASILVGQFGYGLALFPLGALAACRFLPPGRPALTAAVGAVSVLAAALLLQPCLQAWFIGRRLPAECQRAFGVPPPAGAPFSFLGLLRPWPAAQPRTTWTYSGTLQLDFYPARRDGPAPCVLVIHGGGWDGGDRGQIESFNNGLAARGYAVADLSYRLAPAFTWPAPRDDVAAAVAFVKEHAAGWRVDPRRLVLAGRSAGGQIAEAAGYELHDPDIRGVISLYGPSDLVFAWSLGRPDDALNSPRLLRQFLGGTPDTARAAYDSASALFHVDRRSPPTLLVHGSIDTLVWHRHSERLADRLAAAGVPHLLLTLPWGVHALELNPSGPSGQLTTYAVDAFLAAVCR